uniref:Putative 28 kDa metastriate family member n=1 Tax=Rhipicephalus pulchellus TaxID=72859 RepID=L7MBQ9_RHIPC
MLKCACKKRVTWQTLILISKIFAMRWFTVIMVRLFIHTLSMSASLTRANEHATRSGDPIGEGVSLRAHIYYDFGYSNVFASKERLGPPAVSAAIKEHFDQLFDQVEKHFEMHSIILKMVTSSVSRKDDLSVYRGSTLDVRSTLEKLKSHGMSLKKSNDTIFFFFVWTRLLGGGRNTVGQGAYNTEATFCTESVSAAIIRHYPKSNVRLTLQKATAFM